MRDEIVEKLRQMLSANIDSECKVVYTLCEIRKLLDKYPPDPEPFALKLYYHWALHIDLTGADTTLPLLQRIDSFVERITTGPERFRDDLTMFREFLFLETFRQQLKEVLKSYRLPTALCDVDARWHEFLEHYAGVIEDGSLSCRAKPQQLKHVKQVVFSKGRKRPDNPHVPFDMQWEIFLNDDRELVVDVYATLLPNGEPFYGSNLTLRRWNFTPVA